MSVLENLYKGKINPAERLVEDASEYQKLNNQLTEYIKELTTLLNDEDKQLCLKIEDIIGDINFVAEKETFIEGFRLGAQMIMEIMYYKSRNYV